MRVSMHRKAAFRSRLSRRSSSHWKRGVDPRPSFVHIIHHPFIRTRLLPYQHRPRPRGSRPVEQVVRRVGVRRRPHRRRVEARVGSVPVLVTRRRRRTDHLWPSRTEVALKVRIRRCVLKHGDEETIGALDQLWALPQCKVGLVVPPHLVVVFPVPRV